MHRIAFKIAMVVAAAAGAVGSVTAAVSGSISLAYPLITALAAGFAAWSVANRLLAARLQRLEGTLDEIRKESGRTDAFRRHGEQNRPVGQSGRSGQSRQGGQSGQEGQGGESERDGKRGSGRESGQTDGAPHDGDDEIDVLLRRADQASIAVRRRIAELKRADHHRREYVGDVSHELKTPIFAIQGFAETLLTGALDDRKVSRGFVEKILQNAGRLNALVRDLTDISRLEAGALVLTMAPLDVRQMLEDVREGQDLAARAKAIEVRVEVEADVSHVRGDRERIRQVLANLVDNAVKYTDCGGIVRLRAETAAPGDVRLAVIDNGIGIGDEDVYRVTERFYRADKSRSRAQGGTGLGLAIVKHILAAHRTSVAIDSTVGRGSTFSFTLPAVESPGR